MKTKIIPFEIYCDGSCKKLGDTSFGGWSYIIIYDGKIIAKNFGSEVGATNQRMELLAAIEGIKMVQNYKQEHDYVRIYSDSAYFINCCNQNWYQTWLSNGWRTSTKKPVANVDLWQQIIPYFDRLDYHFYKVEGHAGIALNEMCDKMAQDAAKRLKENWKGYDNQ